MFWCFFSLSDASCFRRTIQALSLPDLAPTKDANKEKFGSRNAKFYESLLGVLYQSSYNIYLPALAFQRELGRRYLGEHIVRVCFSNWMVFLRFICFRKVNVLYIIYAWAIYVSPLSFSIMVRNVLTLEFHLEWCAMSKGTGSLSRTRCSSNPSSYLISYGRPYVTNQSARCSSV